MDSDIAARLDAALSGPDPVRARIGTPGFSKPLLQGFSAIDRGRGNIVLVRGRSEPPVVEFAPQAEDNVVLWGGARRGSSRIVVFGRDNTVIFNTSEKLSLRVSVVDSGHLLFWGAGATCNSGNIVVGAGGEGTSVLVGEDCMFSQDVELRATDSHAMIDLATRRRVNPPASIVLGPHVWLGHGAKVLAGVEIGAGSIVGASALVTASLPGYVVAAGVPARVLRSGVTWTRQANPQERDIEAMLGRLAASGVPVPELDPDQPAGAA